MRPSQSYDTRRWSLRRPDRTRSDLLDSQLVQCVAHRIDRVTHLIGADRADASDAEGFELSELAWIENEALVTDTIVECLEDVFRIRRSMKGDNDGSLQLRIDKNAEAELHHPAHEHFVVGRVARQPRCLAAGGAILFERCIERNDDVG